MEGKFRGQTGVTEDVGQGGSQWVEPREHVEGGSIPANYQRGSRLKAPVNGQVKEQGEGFRRGTGLRVVGDFLMKGGLCVQSAVLAKDSDGGSLLLC